MNTDEFRQSFSDKKEEALKQSDSLLAKWKRRQEEKKAAVQVAEPERGVVICMCCERRVEKFPHECQEVKR